MTTEQPTRPTLRGSFGMTASTHWLASATGQSVLERGGNAFDAAVAAGFVLQVVEPHLNGPGGDLVGVFATADGPATVLDGQGPAPAGATIEHYRSEDLTLVPGAGGLAAAIPGATDAWLLLLRDHGTWEPADVLAPAIGYARHGYPAVAGIGHTIATVAALFERHWPSSAERWLPQGRPPAAGAVLTNPVWADTLEKLLAAAAGAPDREQRIDAVRTEWAEGFVAEAAAAFLARPHRHSDGADHAAVITVADLAGHRAGYEAPLTLDFGGVTVVKSGPFGQGPVLLQTLALLSGIDEVDPSTPLGAHHVLEAMKLALADRDAWYGSQANPAVMAELLSPTYTDERRLLIGTEASVDFRPGSPGGRTPFRPPLMTEQPSDAVGVGEPTVRPTGETRGDTCHVDVIDRWGNVVSVTPSGGWLQSSPTIPELGFCLGSRLQMTWLQPGTPSSLVPGGRPRTTLSPTLLLSQGRPIAALGTPGGDQQDQWQLLYLLRTLVLGQSPQQAIDAPALHTTSMPGSFWPRTWTPGGAVVEGRLGAEVIDSLTARGHQVTRAGDWTLGRLSVAGVEPDTGLLYAAANARGDQGYAAGR